MLAAGGCMAVDYANLAGVWPALASAHIFGTLRCQTLNYNTVVLLAL